MNTTKITVYYRSVDHFSKSRSFKTLAGAQKFAQSYVGETPEIGSSYAISGDGVGRIKVRGALLSDLFPKCFDAPEPQPGPSDPHGHEYFNEDEAYEKEMDRWASSEDCPEWAR